MLLNLVFFSTLGLAEESQPVKKLIDGASDGKLTPDINPMEIITALFVVILGIIAVAWLLRRFGSMHSPMGGSIRVMGGISMGTRERIVLLQVGEEQLLVGVAPGRIQTLHVLEKPISDLNPQAQSISSFADRFKVALQGKKKA